MRNEPIRLALHPSLIKPDSCLQCISMLANCVWTLALMLSWWQAALRADICSSKGDSSDLVWHFNKVWGGGLTRVIKRMVEFESSRGQNIMIVVGVQTKNSPALKKKKSCFWWGRVASGIGETIKYNPGIPGRVIDPWRFIWCQNYAGEKGFLTLESLSQWESLHFSSWRVEIEIEIDLNALMQCFSGWCHIFLQETLKPS